MGRAKGGYAKKKNAKPATIVKAVSAVKTVNLFEDIGLMTQQVMGADAARAMDSAVHNWLPTGCYPLDLAINRGIPAGKLVEIWGKKASCKTGLALTFVKQAQVHGGGGVWVDVDGNGFSDSLADDEVQVDRQNNWQYVRPGYAERALRCIEVAAIRAADSVFPTVIVLDSVAGLCPKSRFIEQGDARLEETSAKGELARLLSDWLRGGILDKIAGSNVYLVFINQVRSKLTFGAPVPTWTTTGGNALPFYGHVRLELTNMGAESQTISGVKTKLGSLIQVYVEKSKVGPDDRTIFFPFYNRADQPVRGIDDYMSQLLYLVDQKVIIKGESGYYKLDDKQKYMRDWRNMMVESADFANRIKLMVYNAFQAEHGIQPDHA